MTGPHHGMAADAAVAAAAAEVGGPILAGVEVRTDDFRRSQRTVMAIRGLVFGTGFAIAFVGGLGWVLLSVGAVRARSS